MFESCLRNKHCRPRCATADCCSMKNESCLRNYRSPTSVGLHSFWGLSHATPKLFYWCPANNIKLSQGRQPTPHHSKGRGRGGVCNSNVQPSTFHVPRSMFHVPCSTFHVQCSMFHVQCSTYTTFFAASLSFCRKYTCLSHLFYRKMA